MQILEIVTKVSATGIPRKIYYEIMAQEVDTVGPDSPEGKQALADDMSRAQPRGTGYAVPLSNISKKYLVTRSLPNMIDIAKDNLDGRLVNSLTKFQNKLQSKIEGLSESQKGREYNHLEDLVFFDGQAGAERAADILEQFATNEKDISIKWDGNPTLYYGREPDGTFVMVGKNGWGRNRSTNPEDLENFIMMSGRGEDWRAAFARSLTDIWDDLEQSTPESFRGYVYGDLLFIPAKPAKKTSNGYEFTPNKVTYTVDPNSELGKRVANAQVGVVLHSKFDHWGDKTGEPIRDVDAFNSPNVLALGQTYVTHKPKINTAEIKKIRSAASKYGKVVDDLIAPKPGLSDMSNIIYTFVNQTVKGGDLSKISADGFFNWLQSSKVSANKQAKIQAIADANPRAFPALFELVNMVANAKNDIIDQLDRASTDVKSRTGDEAGGEGYVSLKSKTKLVPRHRWTPN